METGNNEQEEQEAGHVLRHYCKVCNKGFGCAGALGSHMRAHVIGGDCENISTIKTEAANKHSYFLRAKTPRFMGHQASSIDHDSGQEYRKSSASSTSRFGNDKERLPILMSPPLPSTGSRHDSSTTREEEDLANCLVMLSKKPCPDKEENKAKEVAERGLFQCKACKKVFTSHQALGGHRASHKKVKGCFAAKVDDHSHHDEDNPEEDSIQVDHDHVATPEPESTRSTSMKSRSYKMHECSVCRRVFTSGQALGGHKRCHWLTTSTDNAFIPNFHDFQYGHQNQFQQQQQQQQQQQFYQKPVLATNNPNQHDRYHDKQIDLNLNLHAPKLDSTSRYEASTTLYLQQLATNSSTIKSSDNEDRPAGCEVKVRKLSDLRDVSMDGGWLQMGIASTTDIC